LYLIAVLRIIFGAAGITVAALLAREMRMPFALLETSGLALALALLSLLAWLHIKYKTPFTEDVFLVQVLGDVFLLTVALFLANGFPSPFDDIFVVPLIVGAYTLRMRRFLIVVAAIVSCCVFLSTSQGPPLAFPVWVDVAAHIAVVLIVTYLAFTVGKISRDHDRRVARMREEALSARNAAALHGIAAQAAHSISTPLGTMAIAVSELGRGNLSPCERNDVLATLAAQIEICKTSLTRLLASTDGALGAQTQVLGVDDVLRAVCEDFELMHPAKTVSLEFEGDNSAPAIAVERSLLDALIVLLEDCGADPPHDTMVTARWGPSSVTIGMTGPGSWPISRISFPGQARTSGLRGLHDGGQKSLTLAASIINRFGGAVTYRPGADGKWVQVMLPLPVTRRAQ